MCAINEKVGSRNKKGRVRKQLAVMIKPLEGWIDAIQKVRLEHEAKATNNRLLDIISMYCQLQHLHNST